MEEKELRAKIAEEGRDLIGLLHNEIIEAFQKYHPKPEVAIFVLDMAKFEIMLDTYKRHFKG